MVGGKIWHTTFPEVLISMMIDDSLVISTGGSSVLYFPNRTVSYLFYYTNSDFRDMGIVGENIACRQNRPWRNKFLLLAKL